MLMRSHNPIHGVGRLAWRRGASQKVNAPNATRTTMLDDGVESEPLSECRGSHTDCEEHEKNCHAAQSHVHGVAQRASAGCQYLTLVHRGKRPEEAKRTVDQHQAPDDTQGAISIRRLPDAPSEGGHQDGVHRAEPHPQRSRRSADGGQFAGSLEMRL